VVEPLPNWPYWFLPHVQSVPSVRTAKVKEFPAAKDRHEDDVPIWFGLVRVMVVPSPTWP
jgi:hypothetical protein